MSIVQKTEKSTRREMMTALHKTQVIFNCLGMDSMRQVIDKIHLMPRDEHKNMFAVLGKPAVTMPTFEENPGIWVFDDEETGIRLYLISDSHRKNAFKGTAFEASTGNCETPDLKAAFDRLLDYLTEKSQEVPA